jgi:hypothetical protein
MEHGKLKCRALAVTISVQARDTDMDKFRVFQGTQAQPRKQKDLQLLHAVGALDGDSVIFG